MPISEILLPLIYNQFIALKLNTKSLDCEVVLRNCKCSKLYFTRIGGAASTTFRNSNPRYQHNVVSGEDGGKFHSK